MNHPDVQTLGALREWAAKSHWPIQRSVKTELRANTIAKIRQGDSLFPGIIGYDETVIPQIVNALLSKHDVLFLGLRGQAKTRIIRMLPQLLDEWLPTLAGSDIPDDPLQPRFGPNRRIVAEQGDDARIRWLHRDERFHEKLATPDVTIADLIGEIDLIKHAEGRHLDDENVLHYGLIPRTNRGIFAINELPDLAPRIQVGLFNALEERDIQIRGFGVRMPLDVCMAFTANPEDYTNRGRIVTPLKDRIGSVIRTHYPTSLDDGMAITRQTAWLERNGEWKVEVPPFMLEVVEEIARGARSSAHVNQQSGVSVRASIAGAELLVSNAERRCLMHGECHVVPRITDLQYLLAGCRGKIELLLADDERAEDQLIGSITGEAIKTVFSRYAKAADLQLLLDAFRDSKTTMEVGDDISTQQLLENSRRIKGLHDAAAQFCAACQVPVSPAYLAAGVEFVLDALYVNNRLSKYVSQGRTFYKR